MKATPAIRICQAVSIATLAVLPFAIVALTRQQTSNLPRIQLMQNMGKQPRLDPEQASELFADGRAMRPMIAGTLAREDLIAQREVEQGVALAFTPALPAPPADEDIQN